MAFVHANRVQETTSTTGTGTYDLNGAATGFQSFVAGIGNGNTCVYTCTDGTNWECGIGTVASDSPDTLARTNVVSSSNGNAAVNWGAGTKDIFVTPIASVMPFLNAANTFSALQTLSAGLTFGGSTLANYEEAFSTSAWTPAITFGGGSTGITYASRAGSHGRWGKFGWITGTISLSNKGSSTGQARITGLPYTCAACGSNDMSIAYVENINFQTNALQLGMAVGGSGTLIAGIYQSLDNGALGATQETDFANNSVIAFGGTYPIA